MKKILALLLAMSMVLAMAACGGSASSGAASSGDGSDTPAAAGEPTTVDTDTSTLRLNLASEPDYLDPALNSSVDGACLAVNSFCGLLTYDADGNVVPDIAEEMPEVSDDGLVYTFHLRESNWSDGTPLTANDFVYSWNRAANPLTASDYGYLYDGLIAFNPAAQETDADGNYTDAAKAAQEANEILTGLEAPDDYTLVVNLVSPCPYFVSLCAFPTFFPVPQAPVEAANTDFTNPGAWCQEAGFVSNGPFVCTEWKHDESMTYQKNPEYWNADSVSIETLEFMLSADDTAIYSAYNAGNLDFIDTIPTDEIGNLNGVSDEFYIIPNLGTYYVGFNVNSTLFERKTPEQANMVRKAISLLIDRDYIVETVAQSGQELACTFIPTGMSDGNGSVFRQNTAAYTYPAEGAIGYYDPSPDAYDDNLQEALELLGSAGYVIEDGKLSADTPLSFTYLTNTGTGHQKIAEAMQQDLAAVGIEMSIEAEDWNVFLEDRKAGKFDVAREGWLADFDDPINMLEMWTTTSGNNDMQFGRDVNGSIPSYAPQNWSTYDNMIASIKSETNLEQRVALMHQAEDMMMETFAVTPIYYYNDIYMMKSNVTGMYANVFGYKFFQAVTKTA